MPEGLEDVSKVPNVVAELLRRGWSETDVKSALGNNLLRVLRATEKVCWRRTQTQVSGRKKKKQHICTEAFPPIPLPIPPGSTSSH